MHAASKTLVVTVLQPSELQETASITEAVAWRIEGDLSKSDDNNDNV